MARKGSSSAATRAISAFGIVTTMLLPGGVELLHYEPKHSSPLDI